MSGYRSDGVDTEEKICVVDMSIFRVPHILKDIPENIAASSREAYVPKRVFLGPHHHKSDDLLPMSDHKERALRRMMTRLHVNSNEDFVVGALEKLKADIKNNYEEEIEEIDFKRLTLDACFILEVLRTMTGDEPPQASERYEPFFQMPRLNCSEYDIMYDIFKLENQIPLVVLKKLLELEDNSSNIDNKLWKILHVSLTGLYPFSDDIQENEWPWQPAEQNNVPHLLGLLYNLIVHPPPLPSSPRLSPPSLSPTSPPHLSPPSPSPTSPPHLLSPLLSPPSPSPTPQQYPRRIDRAVRLRNSGIKFKSCKGGISGIKFDEETATLYLRPIKIDDSTEILFRNLLAFEMCKPPGDGSFAAYVDLMNQLIGCGEDVDLLTEKDQSIYCCGGYEALHSDRSIVKHFLGSSEEVAQLFDRLCQGLVLSPGLIDDLTRDVNKHCSRRGRVYCAQLKEKYFSSPWSIISLVAAIVLLLLTVVQTIFTILSVVK